MSILLEYIQAPDMSRFFFIQDESELPKNLHSAIRVLRGKIVNSTQMSPETDQEWRAFEYVNAAITDKEDNLNEENQYNQNRFFAKLLPYEIKELEGRLNLEPNGLDFIRLGIFL